MKSFVHITIALLFVGFNACNYAQAIKKETIKTFNSRKRFMTELGFVGVIHRKNICEDCNINFNRYSLKIKLIELGDKPEFGESQYPPYYSFEKDSILNISVNETLYNNVEVMDTIKKKSKFLTINIKLTELQYLSSEKKEWLSNVD
ncbi:hypothetical protein E0494_02495 [Marinilabiliaceae bacterium JC040]|nr:hypothetical protein [Marinilabiliaceae bacterium JC040]